MSSLPPKPSLSPDARRCAGRGVLRPTGLPPNGVRTAAKYTVDPSQQRDNCHSVALPANSSILFACKFDRAYPQWPTNDLCDHRRRRHDDRRLKIGTGRSGSFGLPFTKPRPQEDPAPARRCNPHDLIGPRPFSSGIALPARGSHSRRARKSRQPAFDPRLYSDPLSDMAPLTDPLPARAAPALFPRETRL
jgi:hypothetical protein